MSCPVLSVDALASRVGDDLGSSCWYEVTQDKIDIYAKLIEDEQYIHVDPERARALTPFGGTVAHGFLTLSYLSAMAYDVMPFMLDEKRISLNYGFNKVRFLSPVLAGARIRGRFELAEFKQSAEDYVDLTLLTMVEIEGQDKPALVADWLNRQYIN